MVKNKLQESKECGMVFRPCFKRYENVNLNVIIKPSSNCEKKGGMRLMDQFGGREW